MNLDYTVISAYVFGIILVYVIARLFLVPIKILLKLVYNALIGGLLLWFLNLGGGFIGLHMGINPITALTVGILGIPGVILLFVIQYMVK